MGGEWTDETISIMTCLIRHSLSLCINTSQPIERGRINMCVRRVQMERTLATLISKGLEGSRVVRANTGSLRDDGTCI